MVKFQNNVTGYGAISGYARSWVLSPLSNIFSTGGNSTSPVLTYKNNVLYLAFLTTGTVQGGTRTTSTRDIVITSLNTNGGRNWIKQGSQFNQPSYSYTDCSSPYITTDNYGFVYVSMLTTSGLLGNVLLFKLDVATGTPFYNSVDKFGNSYNVYTLARRYGPNAVFPIPTTPGSFSKTVVTFNGFDMYVALTTTQQAPGQTKTSPVGSFDLCFLAYDKILILISTTPFSFMLKNKSICACAGACGCTAGITLPSIVYGVLMDTLTVGSTNLSSTWYINTDSITYAQYYSTNSSVASGGTPVGLLQTVPSGTTANILDPPYTPISGRYYYVIVTPQYGVPVTSATAVLMPP